MVLNGAVDGVMQLEGYAREAVNGEARFRERLSPARETKPAAEVQLVRIRLPNAQQHGAPNGGTRPRSWDQAEVSPRGYAEVIRFMLPAGDCPAGVQTDGSAAAR